MPIRNPAPVWVAMTTDEHAQYLAGHFMPDEVRETEHGAEYLTGTALDCGCIPHSTRPGGMGVYCETEGQGYCNFECPHYATIRATLHHGNVREVTYLDTDSEGITPADVVAALAATAYGTSLTADHAAAAKIADTLNRYEESGYGWVHLENVEH